MAAAVVVAAIVGLVALRDSGTAPAPGQLFVGGDLHSLVIDPSDPSRLFVGGHDAVAVSTDAGRTWSQVPSLAGADAMGWAFLEGRILVGGHPGLWISEDDGTTFALRNEGLPVTDIHALGTDGRLLYAASPQLGVFASLDGGRSWEIRTREVGQAFIGTILVDPHDSDRLVAADLRAGPVESTDGGRTWRPLGGLQGAIWVSWGPDTLGYLVASRANEAVESTDGGRTWRALSIPEGASIVEASPSDPGMLYAAAHEGTTVTAWVSRDGGATWTRP